MKDSINKANNKANFCFDKRVFRAFNRPANRPIFRILPALGVQFAEVLPFILPFILFCLADFFALFLFFCYFLSIFYFASCLRGVFLCRACIITKLHLNYLRCFIEKST